MNDELVGHPRGKEESLGVDANHGRRSGAL